MPFKLKHLNPWYWVRKVLPRGLFARSLLIIVVPTLILQLVVTVVFVDNHWRKVTSRMAFAVAGEVGIMADMLDKPEFDAQLLSSLKILGEDKLNLLITAEPGRRIEPGVKTSGTWEQFSARALSEQLSLNLGRPFSVSFGPDDKYADISVQMPWGVFHVFALERRLFSTSAYIFLMWVAGSSIILFTIAAMFMRNQVRPIHRLAIAAERLGMGRDMPNFKVEGAREVRAASRAFLNMHERIKRQMEQRTAMLAGISHDLRTPLTRLKLGLSMLPESKDVDALKGDVSDMERMLNSYLEFVRGEGKEAVTRVNLRELLEKAAAQVVRHGNEISLKMGEDLYISLRPIAFERCIQNVLSNAEKHGGKLWLSSYREEDEIFVIVEDNGKGVEENLYEEVFKPFFRVDNSRNASTGGVGLGLPIARDIVHSHGGRMWLDKSERGGLKVIISLPV